MPSIDISSTADRSGSDISPTITLMHHHHDTRSSSSSLKRDISRPLNDCAADNPGYIFLESTCEPSEGLQAYDIVCERVILLGPGCAIFHDQIAIYGNCAPHEICVEGHGNTAYCVSTENFVKIAESHVAGAGTQATGSIRIPAPESGASAGQHAVVAANAVLTGENATMRLEAQSMKLWALHGNLVTADYPILQTVLNGTAACENCSSVELQPVPETADVLVANVLLKGAGPGVLYLTTIS
ncbi:hypothetical protein MMC24_007067 [Lignoscripta atroalba]|nr:hypothetical protein [Lignoscripta atroalba]